jgi:serine/threonine-protein kinase
MLADRYRLDTLLGEGGMGKVYAAEHILMRKRLAVKILHRQLTQVPEVVKRFEREALAAAHIDHPNVAAATDFGKLPDGSVYLVLEFVEGRSLRDEIAEGPLPARRALRVAGQIAAALAAAHELSIVHRDLKPENVMLVQKGQDPDFVKVLDFGIAKVPIGEDASGDGKPITKAGMVYGTPEYMAPEQALGQPVDGRADLYALGVILYEMLAGVRPFTGKSQVGILGQQLTQPAPGFAVRAPGTAVPPAVENLVLRLLAREADERVQSALEALSSIESLLGEVSGGDDPLFTLFGGSPSSVLGAAAAGDGGGGVRGVFSGAEARASLPSDPGVVLASPSAVSATELAAALAAPQSVAGPQLKSPASPVQGALSQLRRARNVWGTWASRVATGGGTRSRRGLAVGAGVLAVSALAFVLARRGDEVPAPSSAAQPAAEAPEPFEQRLQRSEAAGLTALEELAQQAPREARVRVALASARAKAGDFPGAVEDVGRALALDPKLFENPRVAGVLFRAAQAPDASQAAFRLLAGPMGTRGADILYDLAYTPGVRAAVKGEAAEIVDSEAFAATAAPALVVAIELRRARTCAEYRSLLERARHVGDARALEFLRPLTRTTGCGPGKKRDCYPCLRSDRELSETVETIEKRVAPPPDRTPSR